MKGRVLAIDSLAAGRCRAALLVDGRLEDLIVDGPGTDPAPGEIYWAKVGRPAAKTGGAFVELAPGQTGFLREGGLPAGSGALVQVVSHAEPGKAPPVTRRVLYKTRLVILTPGAPGINVSRRIADSAERERLAAIVAAAAAGTEAADEASGFILRSAARGTGEEEIRRQVAAALQARSSAEARTAEKPGIRGAVGGTEGAAALALREWTDPLPDRILADVAAFAMLGMSDPVLGPTLLQGSDALLHRLERADGSAFDALGIEEQIDALAQPDCPLPSGGSLVVEPTRALVAVDVNTGGAFSAGAALSANLEAARELPRQLRLRGLGGQVVVDFAPLPKRDRKRIEDALKTAFRHDPVETAFAGWTPLGHFEMTRKRERRPIAA